MISWDLSRFHAGLKATLAPSTRWKVVMKFLVDKIWNLEHIWNISDSDRSVHAWHSLADCENRSCRWTQQALLNHLLQVDMLATFQFPRSQNLVSEAPLQRRQVTACEDMWSWSISENKSSLKASFSACHIHWCHTSPWLCQHFVSALRWSWSCFSWDIFGKRWTSSVHKIEAQKWNSLGCKNHLPTIHCVV